MKKKIGLWLAACMLLLSAALPQTVSAAPDSSAVVQLISGYALGDELYAYVRLDDGYEVDNLKVTLQSDSVSASASSSLTPVTKTTTNVRYVFMIDLSGTMKKYKDVVNQFLDALSEAEQQNAYYTIATFGERFDVVATDLTDKNALKAKLAELSYTEHLTDPFTGVESAITYLDNYSRKSGDLINLIVITDGDPDLGIRNSEEEEQKISELSESLAETINGAPEVIISTLCTAQWDEKTYAALSNGNGIHEMIDDTQDADAAGRKMAAYVDSLYRTSFKLDSEPRAERFSVKLHIEGQDSVKGLVNFPIDIDNLPNLKLFSGSDTGTATFGGISDETDDTERAADDTESATEEATESADDFGMGGAEDSQSTETENTEPSSSEDKDDFEDEEETIVLQKSENGSLVIVAIVAAAVILFLALILVIILLSKKKKAPAQTFSSNQPPMPYQAMQDHPAMNVQPQASADSFAPQPAGIPMRLEVMAGSGLVASGTLYLNGELRIGSAPGCDITIADPLVAPLHARIVLRNNTILLEDQNSPTGTYIGGMRIQGSNRLRSGDVISVGDSDFCLKF